MLADVVCSLALLRGPYHTSAPARAGDASPLMGPGRLWGLGDFFQRKKDVDAMPSTRNGRDAEYPWIFRGRLWICPALVRMPPAGTLPAGVRAVGLFGWSLGGVVGLQYDESPVGPYLEYVSMGALVSKRGALGQWGSRLFVSSGAAERACIDVWGVPATAARIAFDEEGDTLRVDLPPTKGSVPEIRVSGWAVTRSSAAGAPVRGGLQVLWTPTLKALWAPFIPLPTAAAGDSAELKMHDLRLSASSLRLQQCGQPSSDELGVSLPVGLSVDGLLIEISEARSSGL